MNLDQAASIHTRTMQLSVRPYLAFDGWAVRDTTNTVVLDVRLGLVLDYLSDDERHALAAALRVIADDLEPAAQRESTWAGSNAERNFAYDEVEARRELTDTYPEGR